MIHRKTSLIFMVLAFGTQTLLATSSTINQLDLYQTRTDQSFNPWAFAVLPHHTLLASGLVIQNQNGAPAATRLTRVSHDGGASWVDRDTGRLPEQSMIYSLATLGTSSVFAAGTSGERWSVRQSVDSGETWTSSDAWDLGSHGFAGAVTTDQNTLVLATGLAQDRDGTEHWITRKSGDAGKSWYTVDDVKGATGGDETNFAVGIILVKNVAVATGWLTDPITQLQSWTTRISRDAGETWTSQDTFNLGADLGSRAFDVFANEKSIFVVGNAKLDSTGSRRACVVRRSDDQGATWKTVDLFEKSKGSCNWNGGAAIGNKIVVVGSTNVSGVQNTGRALIRVSEDNGESWTTREESSGPSKYVAYNYRVRANHDTFYIVAATRVAADGELAWWVRQLKF